MPEIAPETRRLFETLARLARAVSSTLDPDQVLRTIVRGVLDLAPQVVARIWVVEGETVRLGAEAGTRAPDRSARQVFALGEGLAGVTALAAEPVLIADVSTDPRVVNRDWMREEGFVSFLGLPLVADGQRVGVLSIFTRRPQEFSSEEIEIFRAFGDQAAIAIQNARLHAGVQTRARRLAALTRVNRLISETLDPDAILREIARAAADLMPAPLALFWRLAASAARLELVATSDDAVTADFPFREVDLDQGIIGWIATHRRPANVPDVFQDPRFVAAAWWRRHGLRSFYGLPVADGDELVAVLVLSGREPFQVGADDERLLESFAAQAAVALRNARLFAESERRRRVAEAVLEAAQAMTSTLDLPRVLEAVTRRTAQALAADRCSIWLLSDGVLTPLMSQFADGHADPARWKRFKALPSRPPDEVPAYREAVRTRRPVAIEDTQRADVPAAWRVLFGVESALVVPVFHQDRLVGIMSVDRRVASTWSAEHQELAQAIAAQTALAVENARLFAEHRQSAEVATALLQLSQSLEGSHQLGDVLDCAAGFTRDALGVERCAIFLMDADTGCLVPAAGAGVSAAARGAVAEAGRLTVPPRLAEALRNPEPLVVDAPTDLDLPVGLADRLDLHTVLLIPLASGGRPIGLIAADAPETGLTFSRRELALARGIAAHATAAVERATLYREMEHRRREAEVLAELARAINGSLDLDTVLQQVIRAARELCRSDAALISLREPEGEAAVHRYWVGYSLDATQRVEPGRGAGGLVLATGRPFRTENYLADPRITKDYAERIRSLGIVAEMVVPIRIGSRVEGLIYVDNRSPRSFTDRDEAVLVRLADHAAIAIRNSQLYAAEQAAHARLAESERFLQATLDALGEHIAVLDEDGTIIAVNEAWRRFAAANGFASPEAGLGRNYLAACEAAGPDAEPAQEVAAALREVIAGRREEAVFEYPRHAPTERRWFILRARRFPGPGPVRLVVSHADITSRWLAEEALREREEQARQLQKMEAIGRLAGGIAHDFNNLLTVISGRSQLALHRLRAEDPVRRDVTLVHQTAERAAALTRGLLAFSRKQVLQPRILDLAAVVRGLVPMLERLLGEDVELVVRPPAGPVPVKADPGHLEQVIVNLAVNARDAMPRGGRLTMTIGRTDLDAAFCERHGGGRPGPHALLAVADTGVGMSEEVRSRVFEPFFTTKPAGRGTGLGLSTVYGIVRQHDGAITVESQLGRGSTFRVYLPITDEPAEAGSPDEVAPAARGAETILLVEDESDVRALARDLLREQGYTVLEAATSTEAIEIGQRHRDPIHLLVTDVVMPRMSGRELAERLLALRPDLRVLYISGYPDDLLAPHDVDPAERVLLPKPFTSETLARAVRRVLDGEPQPTAG